MIALKISVNEIKEVVASSDKQRYQITTEKDLDGGDILLIRAVQGHTISTLNDEELLELI